ncbi:VOC family protein [Nocardioides sp. R-C-SC26]|uniref:VOC family protein n=1 Tax=Nocardioides sp. R-C-SC26 TaxID=2870414 RepID=UPI001E449C62|nr:VOC family protein [Nocardioides sp. R-C-SC26]
MTGIRTKITPNLWFDRAAEEAAAFYIDALGGVGRIVTVVPPHPGTPAPQDVPMVVEFELHGQRFVAINGGDQFQFTPAVSLEVTVADQDELDRVWAALTVDGEELPCGWLTDRYGLSWQVTPQAYYEAMSSDDEAAKSRMLSALFTMHGKLDVAALQAAFAGE